MIKPKKEHKEIKDIKESKESKQPKEPILYRESHLDLSRKPPKEINDILFVVRPP